VLAFLLYCSRALGCHQLPQRSSTLSLSLSHSLSLSLSSGAACAAKPAPRRGDGAGGDGAEPRSRHVAPLPARVLCARAVRARGGAARQPRRRRPHAHARGRCGGGDAAQPGASPRTSARRVRPSTELVGAHAGCRKPCLRVDSQRKILSKSWEKVENHQRSSRHTMVPLSDASPHPEGRKTSARR
jgi:hypothetical protein